MQAIAGRIEGSLRAAEEVLDDMLDIARLESGAMRSELTVFALDDVFADVERQFSPVAAKRGLSLRIRRRPVFVRSDRVLLRRLLQNLVSNALRYTQRGGVIVACRPRGGRVEMQVWDTGPGIAEQHRDLIFNEFRGLDRPSPWGEKGLGLGLSICDRIARLLDLEFGLRSQVGRGSVFSVRLEPVQPPAPSPQPVGRAPPRPRASSAARCSASTTKQDILDGMQTLLERWGLRVLRATSADEARRLFVQHSPDVVLADYRLGDDSDDGLDLLRSLRVGGVAGGAGRAGHGRPRRGRGRAGPRTGLQGVAQTGETGRAARAARRAARVCQAGVRQSNSSGGGLTLERSTASRPAASTACVRVVTPSLRRIAVTCAFTVASDTSRS